MHKFFSIFIFLILCFNALLAREPFLATLMKVSSNDIQIFKYGSIEFICTTYGAITIDEIYKYADKTSRCKKSIDLFYKKEKALRYYTNSKLKVYQLYSLIIKEDHRCLINISGEKTLSEFLIEEGLAVKQPDFNDKEYNYYFEMSEKKAKEGLAGIWANNIMKDCSAYTSTPEQ